jgi:hypothetical protein
MNEPKPDFTYRSDGVFVSIFPESPEAIKVWNEEIAPKTDSTASPSNVMAIPSVKPKTPKSPTTIS